MTTKIKSGVIGDNVVGITQLNVSDGTNGQVLITDGAGTLSFTDMTGGVDGIVSSADATAITIDSSENVGIGTSNPLTTFQVKVATNKNLMVQDALSSTALKFLNDGGTAYTTGTINADPLIINADSGGNVGIGTTSPDMQLEVAGASGFASTLKLSGRPDWTSGNGQFHIGSIYGENLGAGVNTTRIKLDGDDTSGSMRFYTANSGTLTSAMYIDSNQDITMSGTGSLKVPTGTTAQRPSSPTAGMTRYNTTESYVEYYNGSAWFPTSETGVDASGGTETIVGGYKIHTFTSSSTLTVSSGGDVEYLVIAGGGGGGSGTAGGGGAGGYRTNVSGATSGGGASAEGTLNLSTGSYTVTVGAGGAGGVVSSNNPASGSNSVFSSITSIGGGAGGEGNPNNTYTNGLNGGSGGGAWTYAGLSGTAGSGTAGQGYAGGGSPSNGGSGGGGAGGVGVAGNAGNPDGGNGVTSSITGSAVVRAGGGGGGKNPTAGAGGNGGGGAGDSNNSGGGSGTANTGSGGGGSYTHASGNGGSGGSGIVIIRYAV
jgi:hypothetical protein